MASESITKCLLDAIEIVTTSTALDDVGKIIVTEQLRSVLLTRELPDRVAVAKMAYAMREAKQLAFVSYVGSAGDKAANGRLGVIDDGVILRGAAGNRMGNMGEQQSLEAKLSAQMRLVNGQMRSVYDTIAETRIWKGVRDSELSELFVLGAHGGRIENQQVQNAVRTFHAVLGGWLERLRDAGVWVDELQNYFPQSHNIARIAPDFVAWKAFMVKHLDPKHHPDPEASAERIYQSLAKEDQDSGPSQALITMARKVHFDAPESAAEYFFRYGKDNVSNTVLRGIENIVTKTLMAEEFGPHALANYTRAANRIVTANEAGKRNLDPRSEKVRDLEKSTSHARRGVMVMEYLTGDLTKPENQSFSNWIGAMRNYLSFLYLGKVALSFVAQDTMTAIASSRIQTGGLASGALEQARALISVLNNEDARTLVEEIGLFPHALAANAMQRLSSAQDLAHPVAGGFPTTSVSERALGASTQLSSFTQRITGAQWLEHSHRAAFGLLTSRAMNRLRKHAWADLPDRYREIVLRRNGVTESEWEAVRGLGKEFRGTGALDTTVLPLGLRQKIETALIREAELAVTFPSASDRLWLTMGLRPGSIGGELVGTMTQFLSWPVSFFRNAVAREWQMGGVGFAGFTGAMVASGVLQQQLYALADGDPLYAMDSPQLWARAIGRSGVLSPIGDILIGGLTDRQRDHLSMPAFDTIFSGLGSVRAGAIEAVDGDLGELAGTAIRQVERLTVPNLWMINGAINKAMYFAMEELDPEYNQNVERAQKRRGQTVELLD